MSTFLKIFSCPQSFLIVQIILKYLKYFLVGTFNEEFCIFIHHNIDAKIEEQCRIQLRMCWIKVTFAYVYYGLQIEQLQISQGLQGRTGLLSRTLLRTPTAEVQADMYAMLWVMLLEVPIITH